jgi:hypothetical protein
VNKHHLARKEEVDLLDCLICNDMHTWQAAFEDNSVSLSNQEQEMSVSSYLYYGTVRSPSCNVGIAAHKVLYRSLTGKYPSSSLQERDSSKRHNTKGSG